MKKLLIAITLLIISASSMSAVDVNMPSISCTKLTTEYGLYYTHNTWPLDNLIHVKCEKEVLQKFDITKSELNETVGEIYRQLILQGYVITSCERYMNRCHWEIKK